MDAGASSCCCARECSLQLFLLTGTDKPSPHPPNGSIFPASNLIPQGPLTRVAVGKLAGWMFCLMMRIYLYNDMFRSQIMSSDFSLLPPPPRLLLAFQGMLAGLALCIIPQKSHSSRRGLMHGGAFYQADVSHMLSISAWISLGQTKGSKTGRGRAGGSFNPCRRGEQGSAVGLERLRRSQI